MPCYQNFVWISWCWTLKILLILFAHPLNSLLMHEVAHLLVKSSMWPHHLHHPGFGLSTVIIWDNTKKTCHISSYIQENILSKKVNEEYIFSRIINVTAHSHHNPKWMFFCKFYLCRCLQKIPKQQIQFLSSFISKSWIYLNSFSRRNAMKQVSS